MASFPTPTQILTQYLTTLKSLKPDLNVYDNNSDFVIRGRAASGVLSGVYGDQKKVNDDTWISSARPEAVIQKGNDLGITRLPATPARTTAVRVTGPNGTVILPGDLTFLYAPNQLLYTNTTGGVISGGSLLVSAQAENNGQAGNIQAPDTLQVVSPPSGVATSAALESAMADGADIESIDSLKARILSREQDPPAGGNETDYPNFAFAADPSVRSATARRFGRGLGTVDVYITTGTTDVDTAVTQGQSVVRIPSQTTIDTVQAYYDAHVPLTDNAAVFAPTTISVPVSVRVRLALGLTLSSVPADPENNPLGLTCENLIKREVSRVLYKLPVGGRVIPGLDGGFVVASDIEENLDVMLSGVKDPVTGFYLGKIPILADRQVDPLDGAAVNLAVDKNALPEPGDITVLIGV